MSEPAKEAAAGGHGSPSGGGGGGKPIILYALVLINMLVVAGVGFMVFKGKQADLANAKNIEKVANGEAGEKSAEGGEAKEGKEGEKKEKAEDEDFVGKMIPLETFLVNLSGNRGNKVLKVSMDFEVEGERIGEEIDKRKPQIRDIIIILLSSKTYAQLVLD